MASPSRTSSMPGGHSKKLGPSSKNLPGLVGKAKLAPPARPASHAPGDQFWYMNATDGFTKARRSPRGPQMASQCGDPAQARRSILSSASSAQADAPVNGGQTASMLMVRIEDELEIQGLSDLPPSLERVRIFSSAFSEVIDKLPSYRGLLLAVQKEYDGFIAKLTAEINAAAPTEARLRTMKAASLSYVGESMAWLQLEIADLRKRLKISEAEAASLRATIDQYQNQNTQLEGVSETARFMAKESHNQNIDILKHMDRMEKQVELLRKQDKDTQGEMNKLSKEKEEKEARIRAVEGQLDSERLKLSKMVPSDDHEAVKEECRSLEQKLEDLNVSYQAKQRDYMSIVDAYSKVSGQSMDEGTMAEPRPLTPRPRWFHCRGLLDPDYQHTIEKAENSQEMLQHMLVCSRTLLSAYGLAVAANKSKVFEQHAKHPLTLPIAVTPAECKILNRNFDGAAGLEDEGEASPVGGRRVNSKSSALKKDMEEWIPPNLENDTPAVFRHSEEIKNLRFSRKRTADAIERLLLLRQKQGPTGLMKPFSQFLSEHVPEEVPEEDKQEWIVNIFVALRQYSGEPDYLAYLLLVKGNISDSAVRDNRMLCAELLKIFTNNFEPPDGSRNITKQKFFYGLREVLPNKEKEMWQDLVQYFPAGGADLLVNYEWLLFDDVYILSPIVYALRLQHLEECTGLTTRLEKLVRSSAEGGTVSYSSIEEAFHDDNAFGQIQAEDLARAFETPVVDLKPETKNDVEKFLAVLKQGDLFHIMYFPALASDDGDAGQEDMP